ncbi:transcriptional regulator, Crp/Fnr family [Magnetococcus marinus MC-1]|uniref:Transcriptional regulator, Crp/Fnr family n=1 Tax=Magnetococcus marinus (strain ATCC BAA-1437 / JCM 17883 / MC-1) TaxID=156889 RepID=A0L7U7_MAGMM|nr:Crp/Fnr family transcriptional regulator [Magnetococcus marinus]ABK44040.1 transcriptional regulator, Crp/Fnr family [Magnetococcus marinus MC-1]
MQAWRQQVFQDPVFSQSPLFTALTLPQRSFLEPTVERLKLNKKEVLFHEGQPASHFFIVRKGLIKLLRLSQNGREKVLEIIRPGDYIALPLMFLNHPSYPVTAEALQTSEIYQLPNAPFMEMLYQSQETCFRIMAALSMRMHVLVAEIESLSLKNAPQRFIDYLLERLDEDMLVRNQGVVSLGMPKHVLASKLSIKPESLSRLMRRLSDDGLILVQHTDIHILDCRTLRDASYSLGDTH